MNLITITLAVVTCSAALNIPYQQIEIEDKEFWHSVGSKTLDDILDRQQRNGIAKNVIIFIGDGMGLSTVTSGRIYQGQTRNNLGESNVLSFEKFPVVGLSKTYNVNNQVPDSASTATAMFTGVKIKQKMVGLDAIASYNSCNADANRRAEVTSIMTWGQDEGKNTGIVTTTRITHATPAASYAHINNRDWECYVPHVDRNCVKDIARQLVEDAPGNKFKVILGGGQKQLGNFSGVTTDTSCNRKNSTNLVDYWLGTKKNAKYVTTAQQLEGIDTAKTDYLMGLFAPGHLNYVGENVTTRPSLPLMTKTAIEMLDKGGKGFVLMVEGGKIDLAHHKNYARLSMMEVDEFDQAVATAVNMTNPDETLIIVTADHSHPLTLNGYSDRGNDILGYTVKEKAIFQTLTYANGPGFAYHHMSTTKQPNATNCEGNCTLIQKESANSVNDIKKDPNRTTDIYYPQMSTFYLEDDTHGGEDVAIYALGPKAHLLNGVVEQNYIAHVISYASCIGPEAHRCRNYKTNSATASSTSSIVFLASSSILALFRFRLTKTIFHGA